VFKAFGYEFYEKNFSISLGEEVERSSRFLEVDIKKVEQYMVPVAMMESFSENGTLSRMMSTFKNCEKNIGRICPDWYENGMHALLKIQGSYIDNKKRTNLKFSFIKCVNSTQNDNHCKSPERIEDLMANTILEMRVKDAAINDEFRFHRSTDDDGDSLTSAHHKALVESEDLI